MTTLADVAVLVHADMRLVKSEVVRGATVAGDAAGKELGAGMTRGVDGKLRDTQGRIVSDSAKAGEKAGKGFGSKFTSGARTVATSFSSMFLGATGLAGAAILVGKMSTEFQSSTVRLVTSAGETVSNLGLVRQGLLDMAGQVGNTATDLAKAMYIVESGGQHGAAGLMVLKAAAQGAKAEGADLTTVADALTSVLQDYHLKASDAALVTSQMVAAVGSGKTTFQQFSGSLHSVLPIASSANISFVDISAALASMTVHGMSADQASQNLGDTIKHMVAPTSVQTKELAQLGISSSELAGMLGKRGLTGTLQDLSQLILAHMGPSGRVMLDVFNKSTDAARNANAMVAAMPPNLQALARQFQNGSLTSKQWQAELKGLPPLQANLLRQFAALQSTSSGFNSVLKSGGPAAQTYQDALRRVTGDATGLNTALMLTGENAPYVQGAIKAISSAAVEAGGNVQGWKEIQGTFNAKISEFVGTITSLGIKLGTALLPALSAMVGALTSSVTWLTRNKNLVVPIVAAVGLMAAAWGTYAVTMRIAAGAAKAWAAVQTVVAFVQLAAGVRSFAGAWALLDTAMAANPIGLVVVALAALAGGIYLAYKHSATFRAVVASVFGWITGTAVPALRAAWSSISTAVVNMWTTHVQPVLTALREYIAKYVTPTIMSLWQNVVRPAFGAISAIIAATWAIVKPILQLLWSFIKVILIPVILFLWHGVVAPVFKLVGSLILTTVKVVLAILAGLLAFLRNVVFPGIRLILTVVTTVFRGVGSVIGTVVSGVQTVFRGLANWVTKTLPNAFRSGVAAIGKAWQAVQDAAKVPVAFVVNHVINPLISGYDRVGKVFGLGSVGIIKGFAGGGGIPGFAPNSRADNVLIKATPGEYMQPVPAVDYYGTGVMDAIRKRRIPRGVLAGYASGGLVGGIESFFGKVASGFKGVGTAVANPGAALTKLANSSIAAIPGHGAFHDILASMARKLTGGISGFLNGKNTASLVGIATRGIVTALTGTLGAWIRTAMALTGVPASWAGPLGVLIRRESGGNPRAINLTDSNAKAGHPSKGLMQTIPSTFAAYRLHSLPNDIYNPVANIAAGIRYILSRYGSIFNVQQANPNLPPKGYAGGGSIHALAKVAMADTGRVTLERGWNLVGNGTGAREPLAAPTLSSGPQRMHPDDIYALAAAIGGVVAAGLTGTVPMARVAARQAGRRGR